MYNVQLADIDACISYLTHRASDVGSTLSSAHSTINFFVLGIVNYIVPVYCIGTQLLDPINSGLIRWHMAVLNK